MMNKELQPYGFSVQWEKSNKSIVPNCCEYSTSITDGVIFHHRPLFKKADISALAIVIHGDDSDSRESDVNVDDNEEIETIQVNGFGIEIKINAVDNATINKCVFNMFGVGTSLVTWGLQLRKNSKKC